MRVRREERMNILDSIIRGGKEIEKKKFLLSFFSCHLLIMEMI